MEGLTTGTIKGKLGVRAGNTGELAFNNVRVPVENRIGEEGEGFKIAMSCIDQGRFTVGAGAVGLTRACLDASVKYANEREAFGQAIGKLQLVKQMIAKMVAGLRGLSPADHEGRRAEEPRHPQHARNLADEVVRLRRRAASRPTTPSRSTARTASPTSTRSSASGGTPAARSSTKARARSTPSCRPTTRWATARTSRCAVRSRPRRVSSVRTSASRHWRSRAYCGRKLFAPEPSRHRCSYAGTEYAGLHSRLRFFTDAAAQRVPLLLKTL